MSGLIDTTEMYLRTIFELEEEGITPLRARIAERLGHSGPTVSQTIARMERDGLVSLAGDRHLELTEDGRTLATRVMRKHRLAERLLADVIGLEMEFVHDEACRWEHVMSDRVERRIVALLGAKALSPFGNPIPGLEELDVDLSPEPFLAGLVTLSSVAAGAPRTVVVRRIGEPAQVDIEALKLLGEAAVVPGGRIRVHAEDGRVIAVGEGQPAADGVSLPRDLADHVFVELG